ncbi:Signal recognition particle receptor FtsY [Candidatus Cyrtobacter comes]|uniref:Signal recognition particle receptor FtsY n=1 Tax=Candidatus Cyrtobacter comes TaxID=675776 RepID=A0ABU5L976_9RICK|nr:signal recognition particle-docking protein FtsY [Candidatus Cyrtobacter comes]MDZ5762455.1 Signal recognition particle receptor FtsY [Candidatus Cyrtobacter comes]
MGVFSKIKSTLSKTASFLTFGLSNAITKKKLDEDTIENIKEVLILSGIDVDTSSKIISEISKKRFDKESSVDDVKNLISLSIQSIITPLTTTLEKKGSPYVIMLVGINGTGKTSTAGKIGNFFSKQGHKVLIAACDTFRAAAQEQMEIIAKRAHCSVILAQKEKQDPSSIVFEAMDHAIKNDFDILILDTAGRIHSNSNLMDQLKKHVKVLKKLNDHAPHECILIADALTGSNLMKQTEAFKETIGLNGLIMTKLDSSSKGGILVSIASKYKLKIYGIGTGEKIDDFIPLNPKEFADAIVGLDT